MQQYKDLLIDIKFKGVHKPAARANMPGTTSLFGYQFRHDLSKGFPLLTTKKMYWKGVVVELLWFLRGDTNIKYLLDHGVNIWNQDAYQYYCKLCEKQGLFRISFDSFIKAITIGDKVENMTSVHGGLLKDYELGDCGYQYGKVWRRWGGIKLKTLIAIQFPEISDREYDSKGIDQIANLIKGLKENPEGRRHIVTAVDPAHQEDLALYWCHSMFQFNCRPLSRSEMIKVAGYNEEQWLEIVDKNLEMEALEDTPKYYLDCHLYQRSADVVLGVPFNIASYALLTHILAKICNMVPGDYIHSFGDVHIYDNHLEAVEEQLTREVRELPTLSINSDFTTLDELLTKTIWTDFRLLGYDPHPVIKAELSTGLAK